MENLRKRKADPQRWLFDDVQDKIPRVGEAFQAEIPDFQPDVAPPEEKSSLLWSPKSMVDGESGGENFQELPKPGFKELMDLAQSSAMPGGAPALEQGILLFHENAGDVKKTARELLSGRTDLPNDSPLCTYTFIGSRSWKEAEIRDYKKAFGLFGKNFSDIAKEIKIKVAHCVEFYYLWKQMYPNEVEKALKNFTKMMLRSNGTAKESLTTEQTLNDDQHAEVPPEVVIDPPEVNDLSAGHVDPQAVAPARARGVPSARHHPYRNLNPLNASGSNNAGTSSSSHVLQGHFTCNETGCNAVFKSIKALNGHTRVHSKKVVPRPSSRRPSLGSNPPQEEFPCTECDRVFTKVKSRSAHMKSHRQKERLAKEEEAKDQTTK